jgi:hypothetical protein
MKIHLKGTVMPHVPMPGLRKRDGSREEVTAVKL